MTTPVRITDIIAKKARSHKITVLTAYDATVARLLDRSGVDALLVGDSLGMVILGEETTIPVIMAMMIHHTKAVARGATAPVFRTRTSERAGFGAKSRQSR